MARLAANVGRMVSGAVEVPYPSWDLPGLSMYPGKVIHILGQATASTSLLADNNEQLAAVHVGLSPLGPYLIESYCHGAWRCPCGSEDPNASLRQS